MDLRAKSVSASQLTELAQKAAKTVLTDRMDRLGIREAEIGIFPDIGLVGLRIRDWQFDRVSAGEAFELSAKMTEVMRPELATDIEPALTLFENGGLVGYYPAGPIELAQFR